MKKSISILGVGDYTVVILELALICGYSIDFLYHFDDTKNGEIYHGSSIKSSIDEMFCNSIANQSFVLSMGNNQIRSSLGKKIRQNGGNIVTLIHPTAEVSPSASIGDGVILKRNVSLQAMARVGDYSIVCDNTMICHHAVLEEGCFIAGNCVVGAKTKVKERVFIGQSAVIPSGKVSKIGNDSVIGAGSVVIHDVEPLTVVAGNPAKFIRNLTLG